MKMSHIRTCTSSLERPLTEELFEKSKTVIPHGVNSPVRSLWGFEQTPLIAALGKGDLIVDVDQHAYIDYCGSWGALIHGHAHPAIVQAAQQRVALGSSFGTATATEEKLARKIVDLIPSIDKIRFVSSGTEATMSAIRLARGVTNRDIVIKFSGHYHGHADFLLVQAGSGVATLSSSSSSAGVPLDSVRHTLCLPFNDVTTCCQAIREYGTQLAAVILEPIAANMGLVPPISGFIEMLREETAKCGALLIFDEVITGFRVGLQGAQGLFDIQPDLTCLGKIIGGGFPAAAFGGRADIMEALAPGGKVYQAGTLSGNPVAMEAGYQALCLLESPGFYERLAAKTDQLLEPIRAWMRKERPNLCLHQVGSLFTLFFDAQEIKNFEDVKKTDASKFKTFFKQAFSKGIYLSPSLYEAHFVSSAHTQDHIDYTSYVLLDLLKQIFNH